MRGARKAGLPSGPLVLAELVDQVASRRIGIFIGFRDLNPRAVLVAHLPSSAFHIAPIGTLLYSEDRTRALMEAMGRRCREWVVSAGFDHVVTNNLFHDDRAFMRSFAHFGKPERIGSALRFSFEGF